ncbi:MAG TPA: hypothetical protein VK152_04725, partial [Paludibacter sp.]|nr:hypothetical protein [Paludibacter sp.]
SGASYWGIMELSGNVTERPVSIYHLGFTNALGDGTLAATGYADAVFNAYFLGRRGGSCANAFQYHRISDRSEASFNDNGRAYYYGGRGVRQAS